MTPIEILNGIELDIASKPGIIDLSDLVSEDSGTLHQTARSPAASTNGIVNAQQQRNGVNLEMNNGSFSQAVTVNERKDVPMTTKQGTMTQG